MLARMRTRPCIAAALLGLAAAGAGAAELLIFGEVHDQPDQQRQVADEVQQLAAAGRLAAVVLEMAEAPHSTAGLPRDATPAQVQQALHWRGWPWERYEAVAMNAVRAGVPVLGGNLPRERLRATMDDTGLDDKLSAATRERLAQAVREGHCKLLPEAQLPGMVRIQIARDLSLADTAAQALRDAQPDQTVLLLAGAQHASRDRGIPLHLAGLSPPQAARVVMFGELSGQLSADERRQAQRTPQPDRCEGLRHSLGASAPR